MIDVDPSIESIREAIKAYERRVEEARAEVERAREKLTIAEKELSLARSFLDVESRRLNQTRARATGRYSRMKLGDACRAVLREKGHATSQEIVKALVADGYAITTEFPGRAIHTALLRAPGVVKIAPNTYKHVGIPLDSSTAPNDH